MGKTSGWPSLHSVLFSLRLVAVFFSLLFILIGWHSRESLSTPLSKIRHRLPKPGERSAPTEQLTNFRSVSNILHTIAAYLDAGEHELVEIQKRPISIHCRNGM
jgi:hypothetical protein